MYFRILRMSFRGKKNIVTTNFGYDWMCNTRLSNFVHQTMMTSKVCSVCRIIRHQCKYDLNVCYCSVWMSEKLSKRPMYVQTRVSRTGPRLRVPEAGPPTFRGQGGAGSIFQALGVHRGRAPKPLEKAGQVGLGNEQTETELYLYKIHFHKNSTSTHELHMR